jgi:Ser/Thr protein kinase RdoA (MazF antagonist)
MPPGLRMPELVALHEQEDDRLTLWLVDVDPEVTPWTDDDFARAATGLGRLAARRAGLPPLGAHDFLTDYRDNVLGNWAVPRLLAPQSWAHPLFVLPEVAALRAEVTTLAGRVAAVHAALAEFPWLPAHGDATPMNLLRPRSAPDEFVLIDWGTATDAPVGFDLAPLVFGQAESGSAPAGEVPARLDVVVGAYARGLATEGLQVSEDVVRRAVLSAAMLRYPCTSLPLHALDGAETVAPSRALSKASFVRMVLDLGRDLTG